VVIDLLVFVGVEYIEDIKRKHRKKRFRRRKYK